MLDILTSIVVISLILIVFLPLAFVVPVLLYYCYTRTRARGYRAPAALMLVATCWAVSFIAVFVLAPSSVSRNDANPILFILYYFWTPTLAATACTALLLRVLPTRSARVSGSRHVRIPFVIIGQILIGLTIVFIVAIVLAWLLGGLSADAVSKGARLPVFTVPTGLYLIYLGRRLKAEPFLADLLGGSSKPIGALYLRSFRQESQFFVIGPKSQYGVYARSWHAMVAEDYQNIGVRFDEYFSDVVGSRIGPFIALGCPEDYVPPEGATRLYAKDTEWMERLDNLVRRASCILMEVGSSQNLRWELEHIRHEGLHEKLFILTRPSFSSRSVRRAGWFWNLLWRIKGIRPVGWREFADNLARLGYSLDGGRDPGPGAVVSFDGSGTAILLTTGAQRPEDFVEPILACIAQTSSSLPQPSSLGEEQAPPSPKDTSVRRKADVASEVQAEEPLTASSVTLTENKEFILVNTLTGHAQAVSSIAISPDGQTLVSGVYKTIKVWNLHSGELLRTLRGDSGWSDLVESIVISPDGQTLVSGSNDKTIKVWKLHSGELLRSFQGASGFGGLLFGILSVAISPDGQTLVSGSGDHTIKVWNLHSGEVLHTLTGHKNIVNGVAISPNGQTLVSGSSDHTIKVWNPHSGELLRTLTRQSSYVNGVAISPDGQTLVSGSSDKTIKVWNLHSGELLRILTGHSKAVTSVAISPDGQTLVSGSSDKTITVWSKK